MDPNPSLILLTTNKINTYLKNQNQTQSYISEYWVYNTLKSHMATSVEVGLILSDEELSDRVTTIAVRRIRANIVTAERFNNDWKSLVVRPFSEEPTNFNTTEAAQVPSRGNVSLREQRYNGELPDRFLPMNLLK